MQRILRPAIGSATLAAVNLQDFRDRLTTIGIGTENLAPDTRRPRESLGAGLYRRITDYSLAMSYRQRENYPRIGYIVDVL
jgi:hypothetical protein